VGGRDSAGEASGEYAGSSRTQKEGAGAAPGEGAQLVDKLAGFALLEPVGGGADAVAGLGHEFDGHPLLVGPLHHRAELIAE
jgi:hypothetical protein